MSVQKCKIVLTNYFQFTYMCYSFSIQIHLIFSTKLLFITYEDDNLKKILSRQRIALYISNLVFCDLHR